MKLIIILSVCVIACAAEYYNLPKDDYTPEQLRSDSTELRRRIDCLMDRQPCTPLTAEYRKIAEDVVNTSCAKCSPEIKVLLQAFFNGVKEKYPADYTELILKYDSTLTKINGLEEAVGVLKTLLSSLPLPSILSLPKSPSGQSMPSLSSLPLFPSLTKL